MIKSLVYRGAVGLRFRYIVPSTEVLHQTVAGESVLLDLRSQKYFGLNQVGTRVWELLLDQADLVAARERLLDEFEVSPAELEKDLDDLAERLLAAGLVEERSP